MSRIWELKRYPSKLDYLCGVGDKALNTAIKRIIWAGTELGKFIETNCVRVGGNYVLVKYEDVGTHKEVSINLVMKSGEAAMLAKLSYVESRVIHDIERAYKDLSLYEAYKSANKKKV